MFDLNDEMWSNFKVDHPTEPCDQIVCGCRRTLVICKLTFNPKPKPINIINF